ncbi:MAG: DUF2284 domain-containing protein [Bacteroidales bacterium]
MSRQYKCNTESYLSTLPTKTYISEFRDAERVGGYCKACDNYGKTWACPPFNFDVNKLLHRYSDALIIATKVRPQENNIPFSESGHLLLSVRRQIQKTLLKMENLYGGRSFAYTGTCIYCSDKTCTRPQNLACRHPELVRPSLEACGFDISLTTINLFNIELRWGKNGFLPEYLMLVCGFFYNSSDKTSLSVESYINLDR